jgi:hypothetical protein
MLELIGTIDRDHFRLVCRACGVETKNEFGENYQFTAVCPSCAKTATLTFDALRWHGLPATPAV